MGKDRLNEAAMHALACLIKQLEAATEGSRKLDGLIGLDDNPGYHLWTPEWWSGGPNEYLQLDSNPNKYHQLPRYTQSIDAAWNYVPDGFHIIFLLEERGHSDEPYKPTYRAGIEQWVTGGNYFAAQAHTPALALCIAALKTCAALFEKRDIG